jgi:rRNA maturation endonuclease Nob1
MSINHLVLDTSALLNPASVRPLAKHFYTTQSVVGEVRDEQARAQLERERGLFGDGEGLLIREPSRAAIEKGVCVLLIIFILSLFLLRMG